MGRIHSRPRILVAGLGNLLLRDDGVGVHAVREFQRHRFRGVVAVEVGTAVLDALHLFEWADRIIAIDAMEAGGSAGTLYTFGVEAVKENPQPVSLHEMSLLGALRFLPAGRRPEIAILGIEPEIIGYGTELSPTLQDRLPDIVNAVKTIIDGWRDHACPHPSGDPFARAPGKPISREGSPGS